MPTFNFESTEDMVEYFRNKASEAFEASTKATTSVETIRQDERRKTLETVAAILSHSNVTVHPMPFAPKFAAKVAMQFDYVSRTVESTCRACDWHRKRPDDGAIVCALIRDPVSGCEVQRTEQPINITRARTGFCGPEAVYLTIRSQRV